MKKSLDMEKVDLTTCSFMNDIKIKEATRTGARNPQPDTSCVLIKRVPGSCLRASVKKRRGTSKGKRIIRMALVAWGGGCKECSA